nr:MAG TPA: minor capsid protein [Caudoviricetes sp.]
MQIPDREYWEKRFEALEAAVHKQGLITYGDIEKQYLQAMNKIDTVLAAWFQKFMQENKVTFTEAKRMLQGKDLTEFRLTIDQYIAKAREQDLSESWQRKLNNASIRVHVSRLEAILLQLQQNLEILFNNQLDTLDAAMRSRYTDSYYETAFTIQHGFGIGHSFNQVDTNKLDMLMTKPWAADGKNFSDRVWEHKNKLVAILNQEMTQTVIRGDDYRRATNNIARRMNVSKGAAGRLVMTESAFFATKAQQDCFKELDVEQYEFIATLDSRTSDICRHMDGKVFKVSDMKPGITAPPLHCHCRSCTAPYFDDAEDAERAARGKDGKTYMVPGDITYKEWEQKFVGDRQKADNGVIINNKENTIKLGVGSPVCDLDYIKSEQYRRKFDKLSDNQSLNSAVCARCRAALIHQNGKYTEDLSILRVDTGELVGSTSSKVDYETEYTDKLVEKIKVYKPFSLISIHDHGTNLPPSGSDFGSAGYRKYAFGVVACHDGKVFKYSVKNARPFTASTIDKKIAEYTDRYPDLDTLSITFKVLNSFTKSYGIEWRELT